MHSPNKNSYLQSRYTDINPRLINRAVQRARTSFKCTDEFDLSPPYNRLSSEQPYIPVRNVDVTKRPVAFGRWAIPKLRRELHSADLNVRIAAISSLSMLCRDPEKAEEALKLNVIERMIDLVANPESSEIRERAYIFLKIIAVMGEGKMTIVSNNLLLQNMQMSIEDPVPDVRAKVASCLEQLACYWKAADVLVEFGFIDIILHTISNELPDIVTSNLRALYHLMYGIGKDIALAQGGFEILVALLDKMEYEDVVGEACKCLSMIVSTKKGKRKATESQLIYKLVARIKDERPMVYRHALAVLMYCTIKTKDKIIAATIKGLPKRLIDLCKAKFDRSTQIYAIKCLTNICEHPDIRKLVRDNYSDDLELIDMGSDPEMNTYKRILMEVIGWTPGTD